MSARCVCVLLVAGLVAVLVCGCGSGTLSARVLRRQASVVCTAAVRRSDRIALPGTNSGGARFLEQGIAAFRPELEKLKQLAPPHRLAGLYRAALGDSTQQLDALIATNHDLQGGDDPVIAIKQLDVELTAINARDRAAWRSLGAPACANQGAAAG
ncbi:MAG TPA: hypothetical protein VIJ20_06090 [Solirubrobacteraceae bacterium]